MSLNNGMQEAEAQLEEVLESTAGDMAELVVYNDDVNTFDWVIESFIEILNHSHEQAEQCAILIHYKGKATVCTAPFHELRPKKDALIDRGISAVIETLSDARG